MVERGRGELGLPPVALPYQWDGVPSLQQLQERGPRGLLQEAFSAALKLSPQSSPRLEDPRVPLAQAQAELGQWLGNSGPSLWSVESGGWWSAVAWLAGFLVGLESGPSPGQPNE